MSQSSMSLTVISTADLCRVARVPLGGRRGPEISISPAAVVKMDEFMPIAAFSSSDS